jgi:hypothetical protein
MSSRNTQALIIEGISPTFHCIKIFIYFQNLQSCMTYNKYHRALENWKAAVLEDRPAYTNTAKHKIKKSRAVAAMPTMATIDAYCRAEFVRYGK